MKEGKKEPREEKPKRSESSLSAESPNGVQENVEAKGERTYLRSRVVIELDPFLKLKDNASSLVCEAMTREEFSLYRFEHNRRCNQAALPSI
uniref:Uncharacterized protein n=1 Tax=Vespula pensylvanica TaxID=30213 RepID=A0A834PG79_VESPE|nr:hypothetical protein H0235_001697 [Vespula pensylvanica]